MAILRDNWAAVAIAVAIVIAALVAGRGIWWVWWQLPRRQVEWLTIQIPDPKARADVEDNFRKTAGQALGGIAVLITGLFAYLQFVQNQRATFENFISQQVAKAFEELGNDKLAVRIGGIYTLEDALQVNSFYQRPVLEALSAFVREKAIGPKPAQLDADVQAAMLVIGRSASNTEFLYFEGTSLVRVDLHAADLARAHFDYANLYEANLGLSNLTGASLRNAGLSGARLRDATLRDTDLTGADLTRAKLSDANLIRADLTRAKLSDADLSDADLFDANLSDAYLFDADLTRANLSGAKLTHANLSGALLGDANLSGALLRGANLSGALLRGANLDSADLSDAYLDDANLNDTNLRGANLSGANLNMASLSNARDLTQAQLDRACGTYAKLPRDLTLKPCRPGAPPLNQGATP